MKKLLFKYPLQPTPIPFAMINCLRFVLFTSLIALLSTQTFATDNSANHPKLAGILFYKNDCPVCVEIIKNTLPSAFEKTDNNNGILAVNNSTSDGGQFFLEVVIGRDLPLSLQLPLFINQNNVWSGQEEIDQKIVDLLSSKTAFLSLDFIQDDNLVTRLKDAKGNNFSQPAFWISKDTKPIRIDILNIFSRNFQKDKVGNGVAVIVLFGMVASLAFILVNIMKKELPSDNVFSLLYPLLCCTAFLIAAYLFFSELSHSELSCGPVGECNTVQQSSYSSIFNLIPVSLLGMLGYFTSILLWIAARISRIPLKNLFTIAAWGISVASVCFFIYLTFLEPFIIGATCIWCITSAIATTLSAIIATKPAHSALQYRQS